MSESNPEQRPSVGRGLKMAIWAAVLIGAVGILYVSVGSAFKPGARDSLHVFAKGSLAKLQIPRTPVAAPSVDFTGPDGAPARLADFKGKVLVLNLWATWCAPCVKEMPTLAKLATAYAGKPVQVVALDQDSSRKLEDAKTFIASHAPLAFYKDPDFKVMPALGLPSPGYPTTVIYDKGGVQRAYLQGEADWSSPEARALVDKLLAE